MTISYPLTIPSAPGMKRMRHKPQFAVASNQSPWTYQEEFFEHLGQRWVVEVELAAMKRVEAEQWIAFGLALNGTYGTFLMGDPSGTATQGTSTGTPLVNGAGQLRSKTLVTDGWTPSTLVLKAGDYIQLGTGSTTELHRVLADATSSAGGAVTLDIFPRIRTSLADNASIVVSNTKGIWRLSKPLEWDMENVMYGISFEAVEAIP